MLKSTRNNYFAEALHEAKIRELSNKYLDKGFDNIDIDIDENETAFDLLLKNIVFSK